MPLSSFEGKGRLGMSCRAQPSMATVKRSESTTLSFQRLPRVALPNTISCDISSED